jgi:two-component system, chemotaxis family, CheB/CheR fusion protein
MSKRSATPGRNSNARSGKGRAGVVRHAAAESTPKTNGILRPSPSPPPSGGAGEKQLMIAAIGASAGGLEACSQLLGALAAPIGFAIVIVQHLAPEHSSFLPELLAGATSLPVTEAKNGAEIRAGQVYVTPPNVQMEIAGTKLRLTPRPRDRSQYMPIDHFFCSLSENPRMCAIGVVLSGTASDGAAGLRQIKAAGGIALAQDPRTAKYDGMPRAAIATGAVDLVLSPPDIAGQLMRLARHPLLIRPTADDAAAEVDPSEDDSERNGPTEEQLNRIFRLLRQTCAVDFTNYKQPTIRRRLQRRMVLHRFDTADGYIKFLQGNPAEVNALYKDILIHVTRFFRDPDSFAALAAGAFPKIMDNRRDEAPIRVWVPGCSTGEEAYSVAMIFMELFGDDGSRPIQVFATDVSETAIESARSGVYPESITADVSPERLRRFFTRIDGSYKINKAVRDLCIFARQDLTRDPPFSKLDLIVCRNVLIYLGQVLQKKLMNVFHYALKPTGFLMLGSAESIGPHTDLFAVADKRHRLYTKTLSAGRREVAFPVGYVSQRGPGTAKNLGEVREVASIQNEANRVILSRYSPPGVLVDGDFKILQFRGQTGAFLEPAPGEASLYVLKMARDGLLNGLRTALTEAKKTDQMVRKEGLRMDHNGLGREVSLEVIPFSSVGHGRHFLVMFEMHDDAKSPGGAGAEAADAGEEARSTAGKPGSGRKPGKGAKKELSRQRRLEQELAASREYLQSVIQDMEAANEELQSANEEILSANEEMQSTNEELDTAKEELQSTNEELNTVNEELHGRNEELSRVNSDLLNLLGSVQIPIVMVSNDLRIRRFTPTAEKVLNLIPSDIGRPISDMKPNIDLPDLQQVIREAIDSVSIQERQCSDRKGNRYLLRVRPYKNIENRIDGAVLALFDVQDGAGSPAGDGKRPVVAAQPPA